MGGLTHDLDRCIASLHSSSLLGRSRVGCVVGMEERVVVAHSIQFHWYTCTTGINIYRSPSRVWELPSELSGSSCEKKIKKDLTSKMKWDKRGY